MANRSRLQPVAYAFAALAVGSMIGAVVVRGIQFDQQDPYNNPYTTISTLLIFLFFASWMLLLVTMTRYRAALAGLKSIPLWIVLLIGGLWISWFFISLVVFVSGG